MLSRPRLLNALADALAIDDPTLDGFESVTGGDINQAGVAQTSAGSFFVKWNRAAPPELFAREYEALQVLRASNSALRVPEPIAWRGDEDGGEAAFLVMEYMPEGSRAADWETRYGRGLAELHQTSAEAFGFEHDNYCGTTPQPNDWSEDWSVFYRDQRLQPLFERICQRRSVSSAQRRQFDRLMERLPSLLGGAQEPPALIHGDLWSGNVHTDADGRPAILDPAAYFAHREAEFGMITLFGHFSERAEAAYSDVWPLPEGWRERNPLYRLYHVLNHYLLFGGSYGRQAFSIVERFVD
jgi:fructosamine-3-kinase